MPAVLLLIVLIDRCIDKDIRNKCIYIRLYWKTTDAWYNYTDKKTIYKCNSQRLTVLQEISTEIHRKNKLLEKLI